MAKKDRLIAMAKDCREAAKFYETSPGLAGHGANAQTIIDIYNRIALALEAIAQEEW